MEENRSGDYALKGHGILLLILAFSAAVIYHFAHPGLLSREYTGLPGIGLAVSQWMLMLGSLWAAFREDKGRFKGNWAGYFLAVCALLLGACYGIFSNRSLRLMNVPVLVLASAQAIFAFSGHHGQKPLSGQGWLKSIGRIFALPFIYFVRPFEALRERNRNRTRKIRGLGLGILIGIPVLLLAILLLASADSMFGDIFSKAFSVIGRLDVAFFFRLPFAFLAGLLLFSFLYGASMTRIFADEGKEHQAPPATFAIALSGLAVLYALFAYIQFRYLFGGMEAAMMKEGYAEYARSGFFQLVLLSCITLGLLLPGLSLCKGSTAVRVLGAVVAILTIVIDFSAAFRMHLYIQAYGLTVLRLVTLWGMLAILIALLLALIKCICPSFRLCPWLTAALLVTWVGLNFINVDARIAEYNVSAWEKGDLVQLDTDYLARLSPDVLPVLEKIQDAEQKEKILTEVTEKFRKKYPAAYDWSLSWRHLPEDGQTAENMVE